MSVPKVGEIVRHWLCDIVGTGTVIEVGENRFAVRWHKDGGRSNYYHDYYGIGRTIEPLHDDWIDELIVRL